MTESEAQVRAGLDLIQPHNPLIEIRCIMPDDRWWCGYFDNHDMVVEAVRDLNDFEAKAVYWTVNQISPTLAERANNRITPAKQGGCTKNADICRLTNLFLDYDNKGSREAVRQLAETAATYLQDKGWPEPLFMDSGTGFYHFFRLDLPMTEGKLIRATVKNLAQRFNTSEAIIDVKCANAARIARVPGSYNRKGQPRMATIVEGVCA